MGTQKVSCSWLLLFLISATCAASEPSKIAIPERQDPEPAIETRPVAEPISTTVNDENAKGWKEYDNRIVKAHARIHQTWTVMEIKETKDTGSVGFTLTRHPLATFSISRQPMEGPFDAYVSSPSLTYLYPNGYKESHTVLAGRKAVLIKGKTVDGRLDESYFSAGKGFLQQVSFAAPEESWADYRERFNAIKAGFRWKD